MLGSLQAIDKQAYDRPPYAGSPLITSLTISHYMILLGPNSLVNLLEQVFTVDTIPDKQWQTLPSKRLTDDLHAAQQGHAQPSAVRGG